MPAESQRVPLMASPGEPVLEGLGAGPPLRQTWSCRGPVPEAQGGPGIRALLGAATPHTLLCSGCCPGLHHLLPPQGASWAGPVLAGGGALVGLGRESKPVLPRGHAPQAGGPLFCPHVPRMLLPHVFEASVLRWVSRPRLDSLKHVGSAACFLWAMFVLCLTLKGAWGEEPGPPASAWTPEGLIANSYVPLLHGRDPGRPARWL